MKKLLLVLLLAVPAFAQNVRFDTAFPSITSQGTTPFLVANIPPLAPVLAVCHSPANAVPCTNYATTYTGTGVACPNGAQDTPAPNALTSACQSNGDTQGNIGFWVPAGQYDYTVCIGFNCFGPYTVTPGPSLGSNNTFTGTNTFTGATNLNAGGNIAGSWTGNPTFLGNPIFSGTPSFTGGPLFSGSSPTFSVAANLNSGGNIAGTWTGNPLFTGSPVACNLETVNYIGGSCATFWGAGDIGAQANAAYAACPAAPSFCFIKVLGQGTVYAFSTPITFSAAGKIVLFDLGGNTLNYTLTTTTTAITLTYGATSSNGGFQPHGVTNGILQNNGCPAGNSCGGYTSSTSATGIVIGTATNSAIGPQVYNMVISGFSNGIYFPSVNNVMWGATLINDMISSNSNGILCDIGGAYESMQLYSVKFTINLIGLNQKCNFEIYMHGGSFDGSNTAVSMSGAHMFLDGVRFEATNSSSGLFVAATGGAVAVSNAYFQDDNTTGTIASWLTCSGAELDISQIHVSSAGRTTTAGVINVPSGCNLIASGGIVNDTPGVLTNLIAGSSTNALYTVNSSGTNSFNANSINAFTGYSVTSGNGTALLCSATLPTFTSGFNTNGTIGANANGTCSFFVTVGSGAATNTGVIGLPAAKSGWNCWAQNQSRADVVQQTSNTTNSATFTNFGTTFAATNWTNGDAILISCFAR
jgi:fibronectin-binding autotransporter adhesin